MKESDHLAPKWENSPARHACETGGLVSCHDIGAKWLRVFDATTGEPIRFVRWAHLGTGRLGILDLERHRRTVGSPFRSDECTDEAQRPFYLQHTETGERWARAGVG